MVFIGMFAYNFVVYFYSYINPIPIIEQLKYSIGKHVTPDLITPQMKEDYISIITTFPIMLRNIIEQYIIIGNLIILTDPVAAQRGKWCIIVPIVT